MITYNSEHLIKGGCWYIKAFVNLCYFRFNIVNCNGMYNTPNSIGFRVVKLIKPLWDIY